MKFSSVATVALVGATAEAAAISKPFQPFAITGTNSPIDFKNIVAHDHALWIGGKTATSCEQPPSDCPPGKITAMRFDNHVATMDVTVPAGQQVYIARNGQVKYTPAHERILPDGAKGNKFGYEAVGEHNPGTLTWSKKDFVACKSGENYKIFAKGSSGADSSCLDFLFSFANVKGWAAWQYD